MQDFNSFARDFYAQQRKLEQWQRHKSQYHNANYEDFSRNYDALKNATSMRANTGIGWIDNAANYFAHDNSFTSGITDTAATWLAGGARALADLGDSLKPFGDRVGAQPLNENPQALKDFAARADNVKRQIRINHDMNRGDSGFSNLAYGLGTIVPEMVLPTGQIKLGAGLLGNALRGAGFGALGGGLTSLLDSDQSWQQALGGAALGAGAGGLLGAAGASVLGHFNGYGWANSPKAGLLNSTIDDAGNIKVDPIVGATNTNDDAIARAMNAQRTQPRWQTTEQMPQQMVGQPHWFPNAQTAQTQTNVPNFVMVGEPKTINPYHVELEIADAVAKEAGLDPAIVRANLVYLQAKHPEMFKSKGDVLRIMRQVIDKPNYSGNSPQDARLAYMAKILDDLKIGEMSISRDSNGVVHFNKRRRGAIDESTVGSPTVPTQPALEGGQGVGANARSLIPYNPTTSNLNNSLENAENATSLGRAIGETNVYINNDRGYHATIQIVQADKLKPSFEENVGGQFRTQKQDHVIHKIRDHFDPMLMFERSGDFNGIPVVDNSGIVLVGNHRTEALKSFSPEQFDKYAKAVQDKYGIKLNNGELIVRVLDPRYNKEERENLAKASNVGRENNFFEKEIAEDAKYAQNLGDFLGNKNVVIRPDFDEASDVTRMKNLVAGALKMPLDNERANSVLLHSLLQSGQHGFLKRLDSLALDDARTASAIHTMLRDNAGALYLNRISQNASAIDIVPYLHSTLNAIRAQKGKTYPQIKKYIEEEAKHILLTSEENLYRLSRLSEPPIDYFEQLKGNMIACALGKLLTRTNPSEALYGILKQFGKEQNHGENIFGDEFKITLWDNLAYLNRISGESPLGNMLESIKLKEKEFAQYTAMRDMQSNTQMSLKPNVPLDLKTMHKLKAAAINAPTATQQQYEAYYRAMWSGDKQQISKTLPFIKIAHFNETFSKLFGIEKQAVFFTKQSISHARESRKVTYNQDLPEAFVKDIPAIINNAQGGFYDKSHRNFFIVKPLRDYGIDSNQLGFIHFNKDILGNYIVTMKRADADSLHSANYVEVGRGIAPHIPTEQGSIASPFLKASPTSNASNPTTSPLKDGLQSNTFARNIAHQAATNALAGTAGGIANVVLDDSDDSVALKFAKGFAAAVALKVAAKHGTNAGARASKAAFDFAMQKSAQFSTLLRENPQLFTRLLNKQLTDDFAQFGGQSSGLNAERYAVAKELAQKGVSEEEILARTGWFRGLDGNWKFQLDLAKGAAYKLKEGSYHLSQLFKQESLYAAYPFLRNVRVEIARLPEHVNGSFEPTTGILTLNSANNKLDFTKALCHELQHIIQKYEGFAQGSSPKNPNYWTNVGEVEARATFKGGESNPRQRLANERKEGEIIEAMSRASDSEIPNSSTLAHSQKLESAYLKDTHRIDTEALDRHAMALPKALDEQRFMAQAKTDSQGIARVETPIGEINVHMKGAWNHMNRGNTYQKDRNYSSGALFDTLTDPLFVVKQKYIDRAKLSANAKENANSKLVHPKDNESIPQDSYIFFKPYKDSNGAKYLAAFALDIHGNLTNTTFFSPNMSKIRQWIQSHDDDLLYYKYDNQQDKVYSIAGQRAQTDKNAQRIKLEKRELERHIAEYENKIKTLERKINSAGDVARKNRDKNIGEQERYKDLLFQAKKKYYHIPDQEASKMDFFKSLSERQKADFLNDLERLTHKSDVDSNGIQDVISRDDFWKGKYRDFADESQHHIEMAQRNMILLKELTRLPIESQRELAEKWNATQMRANIEKTFNTQPLKEFGTNYAEYMRDGEGAIHKLRSEKQGQVSGAFYREDLQKISGNGNIDLVWGDETIGLRKIIEKHGDDFSAFGEGEQGIVNGICEIVEKGKIVSNANVRTIIYNFEGKEYRIGLSRGWKGEGNNEWVITAYERKSPSAQNFDQAATQEAGNGNNLSQKSSSNPTTQPIKDTLENDTQYSLKSPLESLKSAQGRIDGLRAFAKYLANPPAHLRGDVQRLRADSAAMRELDMHTRKAMTDKANAIDALAYQSGYPEPQYSLKNPRQKQKFAEDSVGILQQIRAKSREGMEKILNNSWVNSALGTRIYGRNFEDYRHIKDVFDKDIAENASNALLLHNKLKLLSEDAQRKMHHYMNGDTNGEDLSSELKTLADSFRKEVRKETDELVRLGLLDKNTAEKWGDVYLLREYSTRMVDRVKRGLRGLKSEDYGIGLDTIHMRGKTQKVSAQKYQEMLAKGEIGDVTKGKWEVLQKPCKHEPKYVLRRDYTRSEREKMGEIDLISYSLPRTLAKIQNQKRIATLFDAISKDGDVARKLEKGAEIPSGFRRLNGEQYGALRGFVVRNEIADDIERTTNRVLGESKEILKQIAGLATYWKKFKTVHNPTSHINNMIGNVFFLGMEGNLKGIAHAFGAVKYAKNIARYEELLAKRGIVKLTQNEASEFVRLDTADMRLYKTLKDRGVFDKSSLNMVLNDYLRESGVVPQQSKATNAALGAFMKFDSRLSRIYGAEDHIFRFGSVKSLLEQGHSLNEAIAITNKVIPDYSKPMPKWLDNAARYGVLPFVQFTYHATPIMLRQLNPLAKSAKGEWNKVLAIKKLATMAGLFCAYQGLVEYFADGEMPQGFNAKELPVWRNAKGDVQTLRIGALVPHLALADWLPFSSKNGILPENIRTTAIGGIPQWAYYAATDKNAYYDRPITSRKDGWQHYDRAKYAAQQFLPEWFNKGYNLAEVGWKDEQKRKRSKVLNERSAFENTLGLLGINTKSYNLNALRIENARKKQLQSLQ